MCLILIVTVPSNPSVISLIPYFDSAPGGDLQTIIDENLVPFEADVVKFVRQLVEGLAYLHERKIAHLDIKVCHNFYPIIAIVSSVRENTPRFTPIKDIWNTTVSLYFYSSSITAMRFQQEVYIESIPTPRITCLQKQKTVAVNRITSNWFV